MKDSHTKGIFHHKTWVLHISSKRIFILERKWKINQILSFQTVSFCYVTWFEEKWHNKNWFFSSSSLPFFQLPHSFSIWSVTAAIHYCHFIFLRANFKCRGARWKMETFSGYFFCTEIFIRAHVGVLLLEDCWRRYFRRERRALSKQDMFFRSLSLASAV